MDGFLAFIFGLILGGSLIGLITFDVGENRGMSRAIDTLRPCSKEPKDSIIEVHQKVFGCSFDKWSYLHSEVR